MFSTETAAEPQLGRLYLGWWDDLSALETPQTANTALLVNKQSQFTVGQRGARLHTRGVVITRYRVVQKTNLKNTKTKRPRSFSRNARR